MTWARWNRLAPEWHVALDMALENIRAPHLTPVGFEWARCALGEDGVPPIELADRFFGLARQLVAAGGDLQQTRAWPQERLIPSPYAGHIWVHTLGAYPTAPRRTFTQVCTQIREHTMLYGVRWRLLWDDEIDPLLKPGDQAWVQSTGDYTDPPLDPDLFAFVRTVSAFAGTRGAVRRTVAHPRRVANLAAHLFVARNA